MDLLAEVVNFKMRFYRSPRSKYEDVLTGKLKLVPNLETLDFYRKDYLEMKTMFFDEYPSFEQIIKRLLEIEKTMNQRLLQNIPMQD